MAAGLRGLGMERGDRVGIYMEPSVAQALSIFAVSRAGGVFVPVDEEITVARAQIAIASSPSERFAFAALIQSQSAAG